jgi:hypothetical protein
MTFVCSDGMRAELTRNRAFSSRSNPDLLARVKQLAACRGKLGGHRSRCMADLPALGLATRIRQSAPEVARAAKLTARSC